MRLKITITISDTHNDENIYGPYLKNMYLTMNEKPLSRLRLHYDVNL